MGKAFFAFAICALLLAFAGCAQEAQKGGEGAAGAKNASPAAQPSGRAADSGGGILPGAEVGNAGQQPSPAARPADIGGVDRGVKKNATAPAAISNAGEKKNETLPKVVLLPSSYNDTEYGVYFALPDGVEVFTTGCKYWGGTNDCEGVALWKPSREKFAEIWGRKYDFDVRLYNYLEKGGALSRNKNYTWYTASFGGREAYIRENATDGVFSRQLYTLLAGRLVGFEVWGNKSRNAQAEAVWESFRIGGQKAKEYSPVEYGCTGDMDCYLDEICYHKSFCVNINASDRDLFDYFNSSTVCSSTGLAWVCKRECEFDSDCPKGQRCFSLRRDNGYEVQRFNVCS